MEVQILKCAACLQNMEKIKFKWVFFRTEKLIRVAIIIGQIQCFEADFLWKSQPQNPELIYNPDYRENFRPCNMVFHEKPNIPT